MSETTYNEKELKGMSRVLLRRAAREVLGIDNKEASNSKSADLIGRIIEEQEGGGNGEAPKTSSRRSSKTSGGKASGGKSSGRGKSSGKGSSAETSDDLTSMVDAVGKAVDETHSETKELLEQMAEQMAELQRQNFILFGLVTDIYKAVDEPDALEERLKELDEEWEAQGNDD